ncbi:MAG: hypothetical protein AMS18_02745 [Gemmatimonas sp. SG8_17]|nr:MAG: hypothetical protein AMS18_02745 [Gemmatimonas sp. SG8_17]
MVRLLLFERLRVRIIHQLRDLEAMTDEARLRPDSQSDDAIEAPPKKGTSALLAILVLAGALGAVAGGVFIGPRIAGKTQVDPSEPEQAAAETGHDEVAGRFFELENLIVNPAGSRGDRFLMVSVAFEVPHQEMVVLLDEREAQVRDVVGALLEGQTLEMLTRAGARDDLKRQLEEVVAPLAGQPEWMRVYLPRFVIQ